MVRSCSLVALLSACTVQNPEPTANPEPAASITLTTGAGTYEVGQTFVVEQRETFEMAATSVRTPPGITTLTSASVVRWREEVLAVTDGRPTSLRVFWEQHESTVRADGDERRELGTPHGTYIVERAARTTSVRRPDGAPISVQEQQAVASSLDQPGYVNQLERRLANQRLGPGWAMDVDTKEHTEPHDAGALTTLVVHLAFAGVRVVDGDTRALFTTSSRQSGPYGLGEIESTTTGTAVVDVEHGWLAAIEYGGPMHMEGTQGELGVTESYSAEGRWSFAMTIDHAPG